MDSSKAEYSDNREAQPKGESNTRENVMVILRDDNELIRSVGIPMQRHSSWKNDDNGSTNYSIDGFTARNNTIPKKCVHLNDAAVVESEDSAKKQPITDGYAWKVHYSMDRFSSSMESDGEIGSAEMREDHKREDTNIVEMMFTCNQCKTSSLMDVHKIKETYVSMTMVDAVENRVKSVILTDCANAYSSVSSITAGSADRAMRLHLAYIRDNASTNILSFCDAVFNLADLGTKLGASAVNWRKFLQSGVFFVSFIGRKASIALFRQDAEK